MSKELLNSLGISEDDYANNPKLGEYPIEALIFYRSISDTTREIFPNLYKDNSISKWATVDDFMLQFMARNNG